MPACKLRYDSKPAFQLRAHIITLKTHKPCTRKCDTSIGMWLHPQPVRLAIHLPTLSTHTAMTIVKQYHNGAVWSQHTRVYAYCYEPSVIRGSRMIRATYNAYNNYIMWLSTRWPLSHHHQITSLLHTTWAVSTDTRSSSIQIPTFISICSHARHKYDSYIHDICAYTFFYRFYDSDKKFWFNLM